MGPPIFTWICLGVSMSSHLSTHFIKHLNDLHMSSHTLDEFWHSCLFGNLGLTSTSRQVGFDLLWISHVIHGLVIWDYHLSFHNLIINLCLVQRFNVSRTFSWTPFPKPSFASTMQLMSDVKPRVELNPTFKLATQLTARTSQIDSDLGFD